VIVLKIYPQNLFYKVSTDFWEEQDESTVKVYLEEVRGPRKEWEALVDNEIYAVGCNRLALKKELLHYWWRTEISANACGYLDFANH
jgi:hypothetical protein